MKRRNLKIGLAALAGVVIVGAVFGFRTYRDKLTVSTPDYPPIRKAIWLEQGWSQEQRERFHHADQGTQTVNIPYEWFVELEQPRLSLTGDVGRLSDPAYLDRYGFIPGATRAARSNFRSGSRGGKSCENRTARPGSILGPTSR